MVYLAHSSEHIFLSAQHDTGFPAHIHTVPNFGEGLSLGVS